MSGFWPIYKKEFKGFIQSPSTWVVLALLFIVAGVVFVMQMAEFSQACQMITSNPQMAQMYGMGQIPNVTESVVRQIFSMLSMLSLFTVPLLAMRLLSEERSRGTFELLVTCPTSDWGIVLGKYFALLSVGVGIIILSAIYPLTVWYLGRANGSVPEWPIVFSCWLGLALLYATYSAFGVMASAMTENQVIAAVITLIGLLLWFMMGGISSQFENATIKAIINEVAIPQHVDSFVKGILQLKDFAFYILASFLFLFVATKTLDARRWRL